MIICETIGLFVVIWVCIALLTLFCAFFVSGESIDEEKFTISFFGVMLFLFLIVSVVLVQFKHYPEQFGYTAIEEVEEVETSE